MHVDFIKIVEIMNKDATLKIKVNSHVGKDSTRQTASPKVAPLAYPLPPRHPELYLAPHHIP